MVTEENMKASMQNYIDGFNRKDAELLVSLFADNARIEDPVGGENIINGKKEITSFYKQPVQMVVKLELAAPIRSSYSNFSAMPFIIYMKNNGKDMRIDVIDVMEFDNSGKIIDMKAFHGKSDMKEV